MGTPCYELKSSLVLLNMEGNTKVLFNIYANQAGDVDMGEPEYIENSIFVCSEWESFNQESGGYRIFFTDDNYGRFNILLDPSNLTNVAVKLDMNVKVFFTLFDLLFAIIVSFYKRGIYVKQKR